MYNRGGVEQDKTILELASGFKKIFKLVPNLFIKIETHPIRGGVGWVSEKTRPIVIPNFDCV